MLTEGERRYGPAPVPRPALCANSHCPRLSREILPDELYRVPATPWAPEAIYHRGCYRPGYPLAD